jgi:hypothetical protein
VTAVNASIRHIKDISQIFCTDMTTRQPRMEIISVDGASISDGDDAMPERLVGMEIGFTGKQEESKSLGGVTSFLPSVQNC